MRQRVDLNPNEGERWLAMVGSSVLIGVEKDFVKATDAISKIVQNLAKTGHRLTDEQAAQDVLLDLAKGELDWREALCQLVPLIAVATKPAPTPPPPREETLCLAVGIRSKT